MLTIFLNWNINWIKPNAVDFDYEFEKKAQQNEINDKVCDKKPVKFSWLIEYRGIAIACQTIKWNFTGDRVFWFFKKFRNHRLDW